MKKTLIYGFFGLILFFIATTAFAQGFTGPGINHPPPPPVGHPLPRQEYRESLNTYGFIGPSQTVTVEQSKSLEHRSPLIVRGSIVQVIGKDLYIFRDSSGEIIIRIGPREWYELGQNISPSENIEIIGELHRDQRDWQRSPEIHARSIRKI